MTIRNEKGVALIMTFFVLIMLMAFSAMFMLRTVGEHNVTRKDRDQIKAFYLAEASGHAAFDELDRFVNTLMFNTINATNPSTVISTTEVFYNDQASNDQSNGSIDFFVASVQDSTFAPCSPSPSCLQVFDTDVYKAEYHSPDISFGNGTIQYDMTITQKTNPTKPTTDIWLFYYDYIIEATGTMANLSKSVRLIGDFTVSVQRDNFAKYALFTNRQQTPSGSNVWFTSNTNFAGPIHTNGRYNIYGNPSGTFDGIVTQQEQRARFYNNGWTVLIDDDHNSTIDVPTFNSGFTRDADAISLSSPVQEQDLIDQALGGSSYSTNGIYVPNSSGTLTGGIYVRGDCTVTMDVDVNNNARYEVIQGGTTKYITVDRPNNQTSVETLGEGTEVLVGVPDGEDGVGTILYASGTISDLNGTVQEDTKVTVSSGEDIIIQDNILYSSYTPAVGNPGDVGYVPPNADSADNLLGIVSWGGDVRIGTSAPDDVNVHGTILASNGIFTVDQYSNQWVGPRGTSTLLGGVISDSYGAFGLFSGSTGNQLSGYGRNFVYDGRMMTGSAPPYFPTLNTFIAFTPDITDKIIWQKGGK